MQGRTTQGRVDTRPTAPPHLDDDGVPKRQHRGHVAGGDVPGRQRGTQAAAVGHAHDRGKGGRVLQSPST